jgi:hypothetical protein
MLEGYWIDSGQFLKDVGKLPGNAQITQKPRGHIFLLIVCEIGEMRLSANRRKGRMLSRYQQKCGNFYSFSLKLHVLVYIY